MDANFKNVIININSNKENEFVMDHFFINGLFSIGSKNIIDSNIELFLEANLKVFIFVDKKYHKLLENNLSNSKNVEILIKEEFDVKNLQIMHHEKTLVIDDNLYFNETNFNYFLTNDKFKNGNSLIEIQYGSYYDLITIFSKELLSYIDFANNKICDDVKFVRSLNVILENEHLIHKIKDFDSLLLVDSKYSNDNGFVYFTPGPVYIRPMVKEVVGNNINHHRSLAAKHTYQKAAENIKWAFNSKNGFPIAMLNSGLGAIESCFINLLEKGDEILILSNGFFGNYLYNISQTHQLNTTFLQVEPATTFNLEEVEKLMINKKAVFMVHMDTSYGVLNPIKEVGELCKKHNCLFVVDCISTILNENFDFDDFNITAAVCTSVKGFEVSAGLGIVCVSPLGMEISSSIKSIKPKFLDWMTFKERSLTEGFTPSTYPINVFSALNAVCDEIKENGGKQRLIDKKFNLNLYLSENLVDIGFEHVVKDENARSNWVIVLKVPEGIKATELRAYLYVTKNILIECGIRDDSNRIIRLAISAAHDIEDVKKLIDSIKEFIDLQK